MKEKKSELDYKYAFNKVFTGSYLIYNLGNELINFIKTDKGNNEFCNKRLVYLNPYGNRSDKAANETQYVLHIMESTYDNKNYYELVAISKISEKNIYYNRHNIAIERANYRNKGLNFEDLFIGDIFNDSKAHLCSFLAEELLGPKENTHILFKGNVDKKDIKNTIIKNGTNNILIINIESNLSGSRNLCYSRKNDLNILDELISKKYLESKDDTINLKKINDEQCLAVICDRTNLEDSMSNQIAYFLSRNEDILKTFIDLLNSKNKDIKIKWPNKGNFKIIREHNKIDILLESDTDIIVIENKIDSSIIVYNKNDKNKNKRPKYEDHILYKDENNHLLTNKERKKFFESSKETFSQLSKYYKYIMEDYEISNEYKDKTVKDIKNELSTFKPKSTKKEDLINELKEKTDFIEKHNIKQKHFFILKPEYNSINEDELKNYYNGKKYKIITYTELYEALRNRKPYKQENESKFLYDQFIQSLEYVKSSQAEQMRKTAYIRLKQRINELKKDNFNN